MKMKKIILFFILLASTIFSQNYFISSSSGDDNNNGSSESQPFKTINKINSLRLKPGDNVYFKSGDIWIGVPLIVKSSGAKNNPITFTSYGSSAKPIITLKKKYHKNLDFSF